VPVSSLWTPGGEHKVERADEPERSGTAQPEDSRARPDSGGGPPGPRGAPPGSRAAPPDRDASPEEAELEELRRQLVEAPVEVVIANHAYGLFELAALHLGSHPVQLDKARLAVDALGALIEGLEGRLGEPEASLREALAQIRMAYVQISNAAGAGDDGLQDGPIGAQP
jgi:Domain of unknown function (DUF1844)